MVSPTLPKLRACCSGGITPTAWGPAVFFLGEVHGSLQEVEEISTEGRGTVPGRCGVARSSPLPPPLWPSEGPAAVAELPD